ncbi:lamin tail domain-containing protein [Luteococcus japonicus]|uniref:Competence-like protein n=1 Tax=Luteococcus japonicus LSP_Lj1 TaxID=1255658 RepID=A0A1R4JZF1_9ACTN|nr:lamin tail domain-containing protein [Luteococcus japonicus]SJN37362.1 Competence-like protein [Luteococcus japonicus LSP_Lj1]
MRRSTVPALLVAGLSLTPLAATPAQAASTVKFTTWVADPRGADKNINAGYNSEYIVIKNTTRKAVTMTGWTVKDRGNKHTFTFPRGFVLKAGAQVTLHSGSGRNSATHVYFNLKSPGYVWNNTGGDDATLRRGSTVVAKCTYTKGGTKTC